MNLKRVQIVMLWIIPALALLVVGGCCKQEESSSGKSPEPETKAPADKSAADIRLRQAKSGSVLVLEEPGGDKKEAAPDDDGLTGRPAKPLPPGYKAFRDQHIKLYVADITTGLDKAVQAAEASSGQVINHPIKGFENMGPNEKTLVFDSRTYPMFLQKLKPLGRVEALEIGPSDYITVRLTLLEESAADK